MGHAHQQVPRGLSGPRPGRVRGDPREVHSSGGGFDDEQDVEPPEQRSVDTREVGRDDRLGLGADELRPRRSGAVATRVDPGGPQNLPHGGRGDGVTELVEFTVDPAVAPRRVLAGQANDQASECGIDGLSMAMLKSPLVAMRSPHSSACVQAVVGVVWAPLVRACFMR